MINPLFGNVKYGFNVKVGYFDQQMAQLNSEKTIFDDFYTEFYQRLEKAKEMFGF